MENLPLTPGVAGLAAATDRRDHARGHRYHGIGDEEPEPHDGGRRARLVEPRRRIGQERNPGVLRSEQAA